MAKNYEVRSLYDADASHALLHAALTLQDHRDGPAEQHVGRGRGLRADCGWQAGASHPGAPLRVQDRVNIDVLVCSLCPPHTYTFVRSSCQFYPYYMRRSCAAWLLGALWAAPQALRLPGDPRRQLRGRGERHAAADVPACGGAEVLRGHGGPKAGGGRARRVLHGERAKSIARERVGLGIYHV